MRHKGRATVAALGLLLGWSGTSIADPPAAAWRSGKLKIEATVLVNPSIPNGAPVSFYVSVGHYSAKSLGMVTTQGQAAVSQGKATITMLLPYTFEYVASADQVDVLLSFTASPVSNPQSISYGASATTATVTLPANGVTKLLKFGGAL